MKKRMKKDIATAIMDYQSALKYEKEQRLIFEVARYKLGFIQIKLSDAWEKTTQALGDLQVALLADDGIGGIK